MPHLSSPTHDAEEPVVHALERDECLARLGEAQIGQLVFTYQAIPDVLPVNFTIGHEMVLIPYAAGSRIEQAARNTVVAFHVDRIDEHTRAGWSVTVVGRSLEVTAPERPTDVPPAWVPGRFDRVLGIMLERVTGMRLSSRDKLPR